MSFKLEIEISDSGESSVNFEGNVNHILLLGVLESIKHGVLGTADMMSMAESVNSTNQEGALEPAEGDD